MNFKRRLYFDEWGEENKTIVNKKNLCAGKSKEFFIIFYTAIEKKGLSETHRCYSTHTLTPHRF